MMPVKILAVEGCLPPGAGEGWFEGVFVPNDEGKEKEVSRHFFAWRDGREVSARKWLTYNDEKEWVALKAQAWETLDKACGVWPEEEEDDYFPFEGSTRDMPPTFGMKEEKG